MPQTLQALGVFGMFVLPGAVYILIREALLGVSNHSQGDRIVRLLAASGAVHLLVSSWWVGRIGRWVIGNADWKLTPGEAWTAVGYVALVVGVPALLAWGMGSRRTLLDQILLGSEADVLDLLPGQEPMPPSLLDWPVVRVRTTDGRWIAGVWGTVDASTSEVVRRPTGERDLSFVRTILVDPNTGTLGDASRASRLGGQAVIRSEVVELVEVVKVRDLRP